MFSETFKWNCLLVDTLRDSQNKASFISHWMKSLLIMWAILLVAPTLHTASSIWTSMSMSKRRKLASLSSSQRRAPTFSFSIKPSLPCPTSHWLWTALWTEQRTKTPPSSNYSSCFSPALLNCQLFGLNVFWFMEKLLGWAGQSAPALPLSMNRLSASNEDLMLQFE